MNVIVGIDGSEQQADALALGAQLARVEDGSLTLVHVYPWSRWSVRLGALHDVPMGEQAASLLHGAQQMIDVPSTVRAVADISPPRGLHRVAEEERANVLVVGSSHRSALGRIVLGSVADRVIHAAPCAIAVAPRGYADERRGLKRVGVAYDGSAEARRALGWAASVAEAVAAEVVVSSVVEPIVTAAGYGGVPYDAAELERPLREECRRRLDEAVASLPAGVRGSGEMLSGAAAHALATAASDVDLLVTGSRAYGPVHTTLLGSVARSLVHHTPRPLVVVPRGAEAVAPPPVEVAETATA